MKYILFLITITIIFASCVTSTIEIYNSTKKDVKFYLKSSQILKDPVTIKSNEDIVFLLQFGSNFSDSNLNYLVEGIEYIELSSEGSNIIMTNKTEIFQFFKKSRTGIFKNKIKIMVK